MELKKDEFQCFRCKGVFKQQSVTTDEKRGLLPTADRRLVVAEMPNDVNLRKLQKVALCDDCNSVVMSALN